MSPRLSACFLRGCWQSTCRYSSRGAGPNEQAFPLDWAPVPVQPRTMARREHGTAVDRVSPSPRPASSMCSQHCSNAAARGCCASPLVQIIDAPDPRPVLVWLRAFAGGGCDDLILLTGEGLSPPVCAVSMGMSRRCAHPFWQAWPRLRKITAPKTPHARCASWGWRATWRRRCPPPEG